MRTQNRIPAQYLGPVSTLLVGVVLAMCFGLVGGGDYDQAVADAEFNRQMVAEGSWCSELSPCTGPQYEVPAPSGPAQQYVNR